ncbi:MAG: chemotaxis protein CheA [Alicyclobacillus sp.]|nr:chemotaxis protein CheA [Alicyclobacillus sp.]
MDPVYLQAFIDESEENIQTLNELCIDLEQGRRGEEQFSAMFRAAHTLKGMSAAMGFETMAHITHRLEDVLAHLRAHPERTTERHVEVFFRCIDILAGVLAHVRERGSEGVHAFEPVVAELDALLDAEAVEPDPGRGTSVGHGPTGSHPAPPGVTPSEVTLETVRLSGETGDRLGLVVVQLSPSCPMKAPTALLILRSIEQRAKLIRSEPDLNRIQTGEIGDVLECTIAIRETDETPLISELRGIPDVEAVTYELLTSPDMRPAMNEAGSGAQVGAANSRTSPANAAAGPLSTSSFAVEQTVRVSVQKLDKLMNIVSELTVDKTRLLATALRIQDPVLSNLTESVDRLVGELQAMVTSLRLVPVQMLFQRFPRMVRDLSKSLGKDIRLSMSGLETEIDRTILDEVGNVLVHLIRNAADHGLEPSEERVAKGKAASGTISLRAYQAGQWVVLEVSDDGKGIDTMRVRARAVRDGIVTEEEASRLSEEQIYGLLFRSGFSTAEAVSDISGRGVGLDAVRRKVEMLGGEITVDSRPGSGTTFAIRLPLTVSIIEALMVEVVHDVYAIPLTHVIQVSRTHLSELEKIQGHWVLKAAGAVVPVIDVGKEWYGASALAGERARLVLCQEGNRKVAFAVSGFLGQQEVVNKPLGAFLNRVKQFSGATILGDGRVALIVNVGAWISQQELDKGIREWNQTSSYS